MVKLIGAIMFYIVMSAVLMVLGVATVLLPELDNKVFTGALFVFALIGAIVFYTRDQRPIKEQMDEMYENTLKGHRK